MLGEPRSALRMAMQEPDWKRHWLKEPQARTRNGTVIDPDTVERVKPIYYGTQTQLRVFFENHLVEYDDPVFLPRSIDPTY